MKQALSKLELIDHFEKQLTKVKQLCDLYDSGDKHFAEEIAVKLRILFHNTKSSKSLLRQLKLEHIEFIDTAITYNSKNLISHLGLVKMHAEFNNNSSAEYIPFGIDRSDLIEFKKVPFENWWDGKKVIVDNLKNSFTRKRIIAEVANTDGGAHVDSSLKQDYYRLTRQNSNGWWLKINMTGKQIPLNDPVPPSIRQIAYELIETFSQIDIKAQSKLR